MDSVKERLKAFIEYKKISIRSFENRCGLSYGYVNNMRVSIQPAKLKSISLQFPDPEQKLVVDRRGGDACSHRRENRSDRIYR